MGASGQPEELILQRLSGWLSTRGLGSGVCLPVTKSRCLGKQKQPSLPPVSNEIRLLGERFPTMKSLGRRGDEEENLLENGERLSQKPQSNTNPAGSPICK